jgi:hypothetical protein
MLAFLFPWSFLLPGLLQRAPATAGNDRDLRRFLLLAWLVPLLFFSVSSAKANYYLVVVMPFAAFQLALALERREFLLPRWRLLPGVLIALLAALLLAALQRSAHLAASPQIVGLSPAVFATAALAGVLILAPLAAIGASLWSRLGLLAYLLVSAWSVAALLLAVNALEPSVSTRQLAQYLQSELPGRSVYMYQNFEQQSSLPFYLRRPLPVIDSRSNDLFWGNRLQPNELLVSDEQFAHVAVRQHIAVVVMDKQITDFKATHYFAQFSGQHQIGTTTVFFN